MNPNRLSFSQFFVDIGGEDPRAGGEQRDRHWFATLKNNLRFYYLNQYDKVFSSLIGYSRVNFFPPAEPVVLLGRAYIHYLVQSPLAADRTIRGETSELTAQFLSRFREIVWCTYRSGFPLIRRIEDGELRNEYTSDVGWGCTLRVGQMLIANCLCQFYSKHPQARYLAITDVAETESARFSINRIVGVGEQHLNRRPGDWYAPSAVCHALKYLLDERPIRGLDLLVAMDGCIYSDQVYAAASGEHINVFRIRCHCDIAPKRFDPVEESEEYEMFEPEEASCTKCIQRIREEQWRNALILTVPLMLGLGTVHQDYYEAVKFFLRMKQCAGIIGGRPQSALYLVGYQGDSLIFLDPHYVQRTCGEMQVEDTSYTCEYANLLRFKDAESSLSAAFYLKDLHDYEELCESLQSSQDLIKKVINVQVRTPGYLLGEDLPVMQYDRDFVVIDRTG